MKKYLIQGQYTEGDIKDKRFFLIKGGYAAQGKPLASQCYDTESAAKMVATKYNKTNKEQCQRCKYISPCHYTVVEIEY